MLSMSLLIALGGLLASPAEPDAERLSAVAGTPLALTVESSLGADCVAREVPTTRVLSPPRNGDIAVHQGRLRQRSGACPAAPGYVVLYVARPEFSGRDDVVIEVVNGDMVTVRSFDIDVAPGEALSRDDV